MGKRALATNPLTLHPAKVSVSCGFTASFIAVPYFFEETGAFGPVYVTVNGQSYAFLLHNDVIPTLQQRGCLDSIIFMQEGAPLHIANRVKQLCRRHFGNAKIISCHFPTVWPALYLI